MSAELAESVSPTSRFQIVSRPYAMPGKCGCCGAVDKPCIDFGFDVDYYGTVYLCVECITEAATNVGMVNGAELEKARLVQQDSQDLVAKAGEVVNEYVKRFNDLHSDFLASLSRPSGAANSVDSTVSERSIDSNEPGNSESVEPTGQVNKPAVNKRSTRVSKRPGDESTGVFQF